MTDVVPKIISAIFGLPLAWEFGLNIGHWMVAT